NRRAICFREDWDHVPTWNSLQRIPRLASNSLLRESPTNAEVFERPRESLGRDFFPSLHDVQCLPKVLEPHRDFLRLDRVGFQNERCDDGALCLADGPPSALIGFHDYFPWEAIC